MLVASNGCGVEGFGSLCPEGVFEGPLLIVDEGYWHPQEPDNPWSLFPPAPKKRIGDLGDGRLSSCNAVAGTLLLGGNVSSLADLDALERIEGSVILEGAGYGDETLERYGRTYSVVRGFDGLVHVAGDVTVRGDILNLGMPALELVGRDVGGPSAALTSLREVGRDLSAGFLDDMAYLANLERVDGALRSGSGDFDALTNLREVGGDLRHVDGEEVTFTPPVLEWVGGDLVINGNDALLAVDVPALVQIDGRLEFTGNRTPDGSGSRLVREAFTGVDIRGGVMVCHNGPDDPCPSSPDCLDHYDEDYCCPPDLGFDECIRQATL